jgi:hypothetical protein
MTDRHSALLLSVLACGLALLAGPADAQVAPHQDRALDRFAVRSDRLAARQSVAPFDEAQAQVAPEVRDGWAAFTLANAGVWRGYVDRRTSLLEYAEGAGIPWIPGRGNRLTRADVAPFLAGPGVDLQALEAIARDFLGRVAKPLGVDPAALVLDRGRSGQVADYLWFVDFDLVASGQTVEGARVTFTVNNGNLIQFGTVGLPPRGTAAPPVAVDRAAALALLDRHIGGFGNGDRFADQGSLHLLPVDVADGRSPLGFTPGEGRGLAFVWQFTFHRDGVMGNWRGRVDATSGEILSFGDVNEYSRVTGGIYPESYATDAEVARPMPFSGLSSGGATNSAGFYAFPGGPVSSGLSGPYVRIFDTCGAIAKSADGGGNIAFGTSAGTNCTTPGSGGAGNTHASRMQFYQVNRIKEAGRSWLPTNGWLQSQLNVNVNLNQVCNAYWDGFSLNFFRSGAGCGNTGEIAGVSLHEYGHGLDQNDGGGDSPDGGTAESYADTTAVLVTHDSCGGKGFFQTGNCGGYGDACTACTGVRDMDWAKHSSGAPHTVGNFTQVFCSFGFGDGPCGGEGHCESYIPSESIWDLAARDLPSPGSAAAWAIVDRLWYRSRPSAGSAFVCHTGSATWTADGCATGTLWRVLRAADDDDGNLANGTPHSCALYAALSRHGIACGSDLAATTCFSGCAAPAVPALALTPGPRQVQLDWTDLGAGVTYDLYRNETTCAGGFTRIAAAVSATTYTDTAVADGLTYNYQVIAHASGNEACAAAPTACQSATPVAPPCNLAAPDTLTATPASSRKVNLAWSAVPSAAGYNVYRAAASGGPYTLAQSIAAPATSVTDMGLTSGVPVFYVVRAAGGDCESGNSPEATATPFPCSGTTVYSNDFESGSGLGDWSTGVLAGVAPSEWRGIETCSAHGGQHVFRFGGVGCTDLYDSNQFAYAQVGGAAGIAVPAGLGDVTLSFWHRWGFESGFDVGFLSLALASGGPFVTIPSSAYLMNGPNGSGSAGPGFTGNQSSFVNSLVDLDAACDLAGAGGSGCAGRTLYLRFVAESDSIINSQGWFLDDVTISGCTFHGCTGAPVAGAATAPADGQIQVSWTNGSPASASFNVYRAVGTCAAPGAFSKVASRVGGSPFLDTTASGTITYAYAVAGLDGSGGCESDLSSCVEATATGPCTAAPLFAGLGSAANGATSACSVQLSWPAANPLCGGPVTYNVYRSTAPSFTPTARNRIASGLSGTTYADSSPLADHVGYSYIVRAVDGASAAEDGNLARRSVQPTGPAMVGTFTETFEGSASGGGFDNPGWGHGALSGVVDWGWTTARAQSPIHSWFSPSVSSAADRVLTSPPFGILAGTTLSFWHTFAFNQCFDGGVLEISTDNGATWGVLPSGAYSAGAPSSLLYNNTLNPLAGKLAWCFGSLGALTQVTADLSAYAGHQARLRWHAGDSGNGGSTGWFVDSLSIANTGMIGTCTPAPSAALALFTLPPCRLVDTRLPSGPLGGPALPASGQRTFPLLGACGVPATAKALSVNVTVVQAGAAGDLRLFPGDLALPLASAINFRGAQTRTNNAILSLSADTGSLVVQNDAGAPVHLVLDVNGYFQ